MPSPPPLQLLPAFEAASRLLSFTKAADELHVTAAAVSQQIKQLEAHLSLKLFHRLTRQVELTEAGKAFAQVATQTLLTYRNGHANLLHAFSRPLLRISMSPFVAHELFIPKLAEFQSAYPGVDLRLETDMELVDFERNGMDAAIRFGPGQWPGLNALMLCDCQAAIVASPKLAQQQPVKSWDDLKHHVLIHPRDSLLDWHAIAKIAKMSPVVSKSDLVLDSDLAAVKAAEQGLGVAFCVIPAGAKTFHSNRLITLLPPVGLRFKAYFVFKSDSAKTALLESTYHWIKANIVHSAK